MQRRSPWAACAKDVRRLQTSKQSSRERAPIQGALQFTSFATTCFLFVGCSVGACVYACVSAIVGASVGARAGAVAAALYSHAEPVQEQRAGHAHAVVKLAHPNGE